MERKEVRSGGAAEAVHRADHAGGEVDGRKEEACCYESEGCCLFNVVINNKYYIKFDGRQEEARYYESEGYCLFNVVVNNKY